MTFRWLLYLIGFFSLIKGLYVLTMVLALRRTGGALFCTTHRAKVAAILDIIPLRSEQTVLELGCGDGRFLSAAIRRYGVHGIGYEINLFPWLLARFRQLWLGKRLRIRYRDFWKADLGGADLVFCYLFPDILVPLAEKARLELRAGALLVSCNFPLPDWEPERVLRTGNPRAPEPIFFYRQPSVGSWEGRGARVGHRV
jgi:SAM-dependent methyltransferase